MSYCTELFVYYHNTLVVHCFNSQPVNELVCSLQLWHYWTCCETFPFISQSTEGLSLVCPYLSLEVERCIFPKWISNVRVNITRTHFLIPHMNAWPCNRDSMYTLFFCCQLSCSQSHLNLLNKRVVSHLLKKSKLNWDKVMAYSALLGCKTWFPFTHVLSKNENEMNKGSSLHLCLWDVDEPVQRLKWESIYSMISMSEKCFYIASGQDTGSDSNKGHMGALVLHHPLKGLSTHRGWPIKT